MSDAPLHDDYMPAGWHTIKSVLLKEIHTASNFHLCCIAADALFHARLIGEGISSEMRMFPEGDAPLEEKDQKEDQCD